MSMPGRKKIMVTGALGQIGTELVEELRKIHGNENILDINPKELHQRTPFYCGSEKMMKQLQNFI